MRLLPLILLLPLTLTGCYFSYVDGDDDWDDEDWADWDNGDDADDDDVSEDEPTIDYSDAFSFTPDTLIIGEMQVIEIHADDDLCASVTRIDIAADVDVHAVTSAEGEIRIALTVSEFEVPGTSDVALELDDGTVIVLADALDVITAEEADVLQGDACE